MSDTLGHHLPINCIKGYRLIIRLDEENRKVTYQALKIDNSSSVEISSPETVRIEIWRSPYSHFNELAGLHQHFIITKNLPIAGIVKPLELKVGDYGYALVMEDVGGISLKDYTKIREPLLLEQSIAIAIQLADILHDLNIHQVLHKNINPNSILIHPDNHKIWLTDFSIASLLPRETQSAQLPKSTEGILEYIAPEQTGRMNRGIDFRTDFYSLGVTLYELLTHQLPFPSEDPIELMYCHIAKTPLAPHLVNAKIPVQLSTIVLKLMAKNAEDRYQSATGLKHDLERCLNQLNNNGEIKEFESGQRDISSRFIIPDKLYGRETEVKVLLDSFERVSQGNSELMLVAGFSGIGKTAVVNEVYKPITRQKGYLIRGKFDQFNRNIPFSAFVQAFSGLVKQLLAESDQILNQWQTEILAVLGNNAQVVINVIPSLEIILGKQPEVSELSGSAAQNRFNLVFSQFVQVFTKQEHPLVIFLDDLQWADSASLGLLKLLIGESGTNANSLLVLGAYRDNEVFPAHPLMLSLEEIEQEKTCINTVTLEPLAESEINCLVADTLLCSQTVAAPLSNLIYLKTKGNPFFTTQFLKGLYDDGQIDFDQVNNYWQCNLSRIRELVLTDDVVEFMVGRLRKLPKKTQEVLKLAACIGNQFDLETLAIICESSEIEISNELWSALQAGLIIPLTEAYRLFESLKVDNNFNKFDIEYKFLHDRVQQAAYCLIISPEQQESIHLLVARSLLHHYSPAQLQEKIFLVVQHINFGSAFIEDAEEKITVAQLNLQAGNKALLSTAYDAALNYFSEGRSFLDELDWQKNYDLCLELHLKLMEAHYLNGNYQQVDDWSSVIFEHVSSFFEQVRAYELLTLVKIGQKKLTEAIEVGSKALSFINIKIPSDPTVEETQKIAEEVSNLLKNRKFNDLVLHPEMTNPEAIAAMRILNTISVPAYLTSAKLFLVVVLTQVKLSIEQGNCAISASAYARYGIVLCGALNQITLGYQSGKLALQLLEKFDNAETKTRTLLIVGNLVLPWQQHLRANIPLLKNAYETGLASGNFEPASLARLYESQLAYLSGEPLPQLSKKLHLYSDCIRKLKQGIHLSFNLILQKLVDNLRSTNSVPTLLASTEQEEKGLLNNYEDINYNFGLFGFYFYKATIYYLLHRPQAAQKSIIKAKDYISGVTSQPVIPLLVWYDSLIFFELINFNNQSCVQNISFSSIEKNISDLSQWAQLAPMNFQHKYDLVAAEKHRFLENKCEAIELYDRAIAGAKENRFIQEEALANELAAKFYLDWGKEKVAASYMQEAYYCYEQWGAKAKTIHLEQNYPELLRPTSPLKHHSFNPLETLSSFSSSSSSSSQISQANFSLNDSFDLTAILKSAQTLMGTLELDQLFKQLSQIILQNSGCDRLIIALVDNSDAWKIKLVADREKIEFDAESTEINSLHPRKLINYVKNTQEIVLVDNLQTDLPIIDDYLLEQQPQSLFALPLKFQEKTIGVMYLHSSYIKDLFNPERIIVLEFLCSQASIAIHNAQLYANANLKSKVIESSVDGMAILDDEIFTYLNERHALLFGYQQEDLIGQSWKKLYAPEETNRLQQELFASLENTGAWNGEVTALRKDGTTFPEELSLFLLDDRKLICICRDISDRKAIEQEQKRLIQILQATPDFICICQPKKGIIWQNRPFRKLRPDLKIAEEDIPISWLYPRWASDIVQGQGLPTATKYGTWSGETALLDQDGGEILVSQVIIAHSSATDPNNIEYFSTILRDISDRKASEKALQISALRNQTIFDQASVGFIEIDVKTQKITRANNLFCQMTGYAAEELTGIKFQAITHPKDLENCLELFGQLISGETDKFFTEKRFLNKDGYYFWCETTAYPIEFEDTSIKTIFGIIKNISDRKAAEQSLIKSENKFRTLVDNIEGAVYRSRIDANWTMDYMSPVIQELSGYPAEEFIQNRIRTYVSIIHPEDANYVDQEISEALAEHESFILEYRIVHRNGDIHWVLERGKGIYNHADQLEYMEGVIFDISDRKAIEKKQKQLNAIIEATSDYIGMCDPKGNTVWNNKRMVDLLKLSELEQSPITSFHPEWVNRIFIEEAFSTAIKEGTWSGETVVIDAEGKEIPVSQVLIAHKNLNGEVETFSTIMRDISDRKKLEQELQLSETLSRAAFEQAAVGIVEIDLKTGKYTRINHHFCEMIGYSRAEIERMSVVEFTHPSDVAESRKFGQQLYQGEIDNFTIEKRYVRKDGSYFWSATTVSLINLPEGKSQRYLAIINDISDRKIAETALQLSEARAKASFEQAMIGIVENDIETGLVTKVNEHFCQMTRYTKSELSKLSIKDLTHPEDVSESIENIKKLRSGKIDDFTVEKRYLRKDNSIFWAASTVCLVDIPGEKFPRFLAIIKDISDRKAIERQLEFTQYGLDSAGDCFYCLDEDSNIIQVNRSSCQRTGYTKEELLGMTIHDLAPTCPKESTWKSHWEKLQHFKSYSFETVHRTSTGEIFPVEVMCNYLEFDGKAYSFDLVRDITERKQGEDALLQQQRHMEALLDNIPHIAWIKDEQSRFIAVNQPFVQACGTHLEGIIGKTDYDLWPNELAQKYRDDDLQVLSSGRRKVAEEQVALAGGTVGWLETTKTPFKNACGDFAGTVGIAADLTQRKKAELALSESETKFRTLVENAQDIIFSMTVAGIFTYISPQVEQILGYSAERLIGQSCLSFVHPDNISLVTNCLENIVSNGVTVAGNTIRIFHIDGGWRWLVFNTTPVKDTSGNIVSIQGIGRDVTEKEQKEQALTAIVEGTAAKTGADFYRSCVRYLTEIFQVKYGFLAELNVESPLKSTMLVLRDGEEFVESFDMDLPGTPCQKTYEENIYIAHDSLPGLFPEADKLTSLNMESYASVAISNIEGKTIGNLGIMDIKALSKDSSAIEFILQLFATRVGAEMERQKTEDALRKSQAQLQAFLDNSPSAIYQKDLQGHYQIFNQILADIFNLKHDTFIGQTDLDLFPKDIAQQLRKNDREVIVSKIASTLEEVIPHPDGSLHTYIATKFTLLDEQGNPYALGGISTDITELKQAELALQKSQVQFQRMTENVPGMIFRYIVHADGNDELTYVSSQIEEIFAIKPETALQNAGSIFDRIHPEDLSRINNDIKISAETLKPFTTTYRLILPNKGLRWVQKMCRPERLDNGDVALDGIVVDISDRKQIEAKQQRQLTILETTSDFIGTSDPEGKILYLNEAWRNLLQKDGQEPYRRISITEQHPAWALEIVMNEALPTAVQQGMWAGETAILDGNGLEIPVSQVVIAHKSKDSVLEYFSTIIRDMSDRKLVEEELQRTNEKLVRATRMKDEFMANMSHELRTPLNAILGMTEGLQEGIFGKMNREQINALHTIEQSGSHLLELIDEILDLTKIESGHVELEYSAVEVNQLCQSSLGFIKQQAQKKLIQLHLNTPFNLPKIEIDERRIRQVLINLLNNAVKFTPEGGSVTLEVSLPPSEKTSNQKYLYFAVKDTGIGIAEKDLQKLFQPFVQIDSTLSRQYEGTGLGLFLVKRIIDLHQGNVIVTSKVGVGSCFSIRLPYQNIVFSDSRLQSKIESIPITPEIECVTSPLIVLAEDNNTNSSIMSTYLQSKGYRIQVAHNGQAAIELVQARQPNLILMDIQMPGMDGLTAIQQIRQNTILTQVPIIALTAFAMEEDRQRCLAAGANMYLAKPVRLKNLVLAIQKLLVS